MGNNQKKVVFICGAGHSGSTLLGLILGSHSDCFYCGEAKNSSFMDDEKRPIAKRTCKICGLDCPVWGNLTLSDRSQLYEQVSIKTQKEIIIDSTKESSWIEAQLEKIENTQWQPFLIFLQRDGRAVINSWLRKRPEKDAKEQVISWIEKIQSAKQIFNKFADKKIKIRYEELATKPEAQIQKICNLLEINYQPEMLKFYEHEHHPLGGNIGTQSLVAKAQKEQVKSSYFHNAKDRLSYYQKHGLTIALDLRWKQELDPIIERIFEEIAGQENAEMKWEG